MLQTCHIPQSCPALLLYFCFFKTTCFCFSPPPSSEHSLYSRWAGFSACKVCFLHQTLVERESLVMDSPVRLHCLLQVSSLVVQRGVIHSRFSHHPARKYRDCFILSQHKLMLSFPGLASRPALDHRAGSLSVLQFLSTSVYFLGLFIVVSVLLFHFLLQRARIKFKPRKTRSMVIRNGKVTRKF